MAVISKIAHSRVNHKTTANPGNANRLIGVLPRAVIPSSSFVFADRVRSAAALRRSNEIAVDRVARVLEPGVSDAHVAATFRLPSRFPTTDFPRRSFLFR
jgi:hypothetical protein